MVFTASSWNQGQEVAVVATTTETAALDTPFDVVCSIESLDSKYANLDGRDPQPLTFLREDLTVAGFAT